MGEKITKGIGDCSDKCYVGREINNRFKKKEFRNNNERVLVMCAKNEVKGVLQGLVSYWDYSISANGETEDWTVDDLVNYIDDDVWDKITSEDGSLAVSVPRLMEILSYDNDFYFERDL